MRTCRICGKELFAGTYDESDGNYYCEVGDDINESCINKGVQLDGFRRVLYSREDGEENSVGGYYSVEHNDGILEECNIYYTEWEDEES